MGVRVQRVQKVQKVQRVVVGAYGASMDKTFTTALTGEGKAFPLWWLAPPPFPLFRGHYGCSAMCHMIPVVSVEQFILPPA